jgi:hypothetical protein
MIAIAGTRNAKSRELARGRIVDTPEIRFL